MFAKILVPINSDDLEIARGIVPHIRWLARKLASDVVFLSVIPINRTENGTETAQIFDQVESDVALRLDGLIEAIGDPRLKAETVVEFGPPAEKIVETCSQLACDAIAMSTHGGGLLAQAFAGSVTTDVIDRAEVPILVINSGGSEDDLADDVHTSTVYVALDGTQEAEAVIPHVEFLASELGLNVVLIRAVEDISKQSPMLVEATGAVLGETVELSSEEWPGVVVAGDATLVSTPEIATEMSVDYFVRLTADLNLKGISATWVLLEGDTKERLLDVLGESARNMIAVTHSGKSGLKRWIVGSVSEELIKRTGSPVLVAPPSLQREVIANT